jgi:E3 ubiquitin-protein ligase NRDP1
MPGYDRLRFVDVSNHDLEEFTCGICIEIIYKSLVTPCCRQTYCSDCISEWLTGNNTCPNDRKRLKFNDLSPPPRALINLLNNMKIRCDFQINGCEKIIQLNSLSTHIANCDFDPKKKCKFCGLSKEKESKHNCVQNLVVINGRLNNKIDELVKENFALKKKLENNSSVRTEICDSVSALN